MLTRNGAYTIKGSESGWKLEIGNQKERDGPFPFGLESTHSLAAGGSVETSGTGTGTGVGEATTVAMAAAAPSVVVPAVG